MRVIHLCVAIDSRLAHALRRTPGDTSQGSAIGVWQYSSAFVHALDEHAVVVDWRFSDLPSMGSSPGGFSSVWVVRVFSSLTRLQHLPEPRFYQGNGVSRRRCHGILLTAGSVAITIPEVFSKAYELVGMACGNTYSSVVYILWRIQLIVIWGTLNRLARVSPTWFCRIYKRVVLKALTMTLSRMQKVTQHGYPLLRRRMCNHEDQMLAGTCLSGAANPSTPTRECSGRSRSYTDSPSGSKTTLDE